ncbi:MAG: sporulation protein YqfD [Eubacteriales bacterium]
MKLVDVIRYIYGSVNLRVTGRPSVLISAMMRSGIEFWSLSRQQRSEAHFTVYLADMKAIREMCGPAECELFVEKKRGAKEYAKKYIARPGLAVGIIAGCVALFLSTFFVWDIKVTGQEKLSSEQVVQMLDNAGFEVGAFIPSLDVKLLNTHLLIENKELAWISINLIGTIANVELRESTPVPEIIDESVPSNIIAAKTGQIIRMDIFQGKEQVRKGDTIKQGEVIISGFVQSTVTSEWRKLKAMGRVMAKTTRKVNVSIPLRAEKKLFSGEDYTKYSVIFLKNRIKFNYNTGIHMAKYDKIEKIERLVLFDLIELPVYIMTETYRPYETYSYVNTQNEAKAKAYDIYESMIKKEFRGIRILSRDTKSYIQNGVFYIESKLECLEDIAREAPITNEYINNMMAQSGQENK